MSYNLSKYTKTSLGFASTSAFPGSTGTAALSDTFGNPFETTGYDMAGFDGIRAVATATNTTSLSIAAYAASTAGTAIASYTALTGATITVSTASAGYSTVAFALSLDLVKPRSGNRYIAFITSVASSSAVPLAVVVDQYSGRTEPPGNGINFGGSTVSASPST